MTHCDDVLRHPSGLYAHIDVIHRILDYKNRLTDADEALLNRLGEQVCLSRHDWTELDRLWQRVVRGEPR